MEDNSISLNAKKILVKVFTPNVRGYDPDEVDDFLDQVAKDYASFETYYANSQKYIVDLETQLRRYKDEIAASELERARLKKRVDGIKDSDTVTSTNIEYLQRIDKLEKALYRQGIDPNKI